MLDMCPQSLTLHSYHTLTPSLYDNRMPIHSSFNP